jgi:hypothetical protein
VRIRRALCSDQGMVSVVAPTATRVITRGGSEFARLSKGSALSSASFGPFCMTDVFLSAYDWAT